jgi:hypothetical protein
VKIDLNDNEMAIVAVALGNRLELMRHRIDNDPAELAQTEALKFKLRLTGEETPRTPNASALSKTTAGSIGQRSRTSVVTGGASVRTGRTRPTFG